MHGLFAGDLELNATIMAFLNVPVAFRSELSPTKVFGRFHSIDSEYKAYLALIRIPTSVLRFE